METKIFTYTSTGVTASSDSQNFVSTDDWTQVRLLLQTAGPMAVSNIINAFPVGSKGILLSSTVWTNIIVPPASRLYMVSNAPQRVSVVIEPVPYLATVVQLLSRIAPATNGTALPPPAPAWPFRF